MLMAKQLRNITIKLSNKNFVKVKTLFNDEL